MKKLIKVFGVLCFLPFYSFTQPLALSCAETIPICHLEDINGLNFVMPEDDSPGHQPQPLCLGTGEADNISWIAFIPQSGEYNIQVSYSNCYGSILSEGIKVGIYEDCTFNNSIYCTEAFDFDTLVIPSNIFIPGEDYFMYIDGYAESICDILIEVIGDYEESFCDPCNLENSTDPNPRITGHAYVDANQNGQFDTNEVPLSNVMVSANPGNLATLTDSEGAFIFAVPDGTYNLTAKINEGEWKFDFIQLNTIQTLVVCNQDNNFGFLPLEYSSATLSIANTLLRCDWESKFTISIENTGLAPIENSTLQFKFDDKATFFNSDEPLLTLNGNIATLIISLQQFEKKEISITLKMPTGSSSLPSLEFETTLLTQANELLAEYVYSEQLKCAYDPNDKRTFPDREGTDNLTLIDEDIEYTIRFQNNGNAAAFDIRIVDELDPNIDPTSVRVINSSHDVETFIENNLLTFIFENINLPDSATNYIESQGFVTFRCNAIDGVADHTVILNSAEIIFDANPPIATNTEINTMVSTLCLDKLTEIETTICQGNDFAGYTESGEYIERHEISYGCDSLVSINLSVQALHEVNLSFIVCEGDDLEFNGEVYTIEASTTLFDTLFNDIGCPTEAYTIAVEHIQSIVTTIDTTICEGSNYLGFEETGIYYVDSLDEITGCNGSLVINLDVLSASDPECLVDVNEINTTNLLVFPNPARDKIYFQSDSEIKTIAIFDLNSQNIFQIDLEKALLKYEINVEDWTTGLYLVKIRSKSGVSYSKIIVE